MSQERLSMLQELINSSLVPELRQELGQNPIDQSAFQDFRDVLDRQLIIIFDLIQQIENLFEDTEKETLSLRTSLVLLICEQSCPKAYFQTQNSDFLRNIRVLKVKLNRILQDVKVREKVFEYYRSKLTKDNWKLNLGPVHGFPQYLELLGESWMDTNMINFALSVGLNYIEFFEPLYKEMGIFVFDLILVNAPKSTIEELNIHGLIYSEALKTVHKIDSFEGTLRLWNCLCRCVDLWDEHLIEWSRKDDLIEILIEKSTMASTSSICQLYLRLIAKLCVANCDIPQRNSIEEMLFRNLDVPNANEDWPAVHLFYAGISEYTYYRWAKTHLELIVSLSHHLMGSANVAGPFLQTIHFFYLACIKPVSVVLLEPHLAEFLKKFVLVLMDVLRIHQTDDFVVNNVFQILQTFNLQLTELLDTTTLEVYKDALGKLLENDIFKKCQN